MSESYKTTVAESKLSDIDSVQLNNVTYGKATVSGVDYGMDTEVKGVLGDGSDDMTLNSKQLYKMYSTLFDMWYDHIDINTYLLIYAIDKLPDDEGESLLTELRN